MVGSRTAQQALAQQMTCRDVRFLGAMLRIRSAGSFRHAAVMTHNGRFPTESHTVKKTKGEQRRRSPHCTLCKVYLAGLSGNFWISELVVVSK